MDTSITSALEHPSQIEETGTTHSRKNHRSGIKERARREKRALNGDSTPGTPGSSTSFGSYGTKKKNGNRAGLKVKARRERDAFSMTKEIADLESEEESEEEEDADGGEEEEYKEIVDEGGEETLAFYTSNGVYIGRTDPGTEEAVAAMEAMNAMILGESKEELLDDEAKKNEQVKENDQAEDNGQAKENDSAKENDQAKEIETEVDLEAYVSTEDIQAHLSNNTEEKAPSLTYDSDNDSTDDLENETMPMLYPEQQSEPTPKTPVRVRADTGSFQEEAEKHLEISHIGPAVEDAKVFDITTKITTQPPTESKPRVKHEVKLLSLKRPETLKGGVVPFIAPIKHEVKLLGLRRPEVLKGGDLRSEIGSEGTKLLGLKGVIKLKQGDIV